jgi:uncharacterized protein
MSEATTPKELPRLISMDAMRGFAIFGIFMVNIQEMGMPFEWTMNPHYLEGADVWAWAATRTLFESNFVAIFSMLFGAGLILQMNSAMKKGVAFGPLYLRRLAVLMIMGILHGTLLFLGDILLLYSVLGFVLFLFRKLEAKTLLIIGALPLLIALAGAFLLDGMGDLQTPDEEIQTQLRVRNEGTISELLTRRAIGFGGWMILSSLWFNWRVLSMLFLGAALMKLDFFEERRASWHKRAALLGLTFGLGLEALTTWAAWEEISGILSPLLASLHELSSLGLALGYMGGIALLVHSNTLSWLIRGVSAVGRLSLSNYIFQSVIANILFTFIGLAWFGERTRWELMGIVCLTYTAQVALSLLWLRFFRMGPLEWAWRAVTYLRLEPLKR